MSESEFWTSGSQAPAQQDGLVGSVTVTVVRVAVTVVQVGLVGQRNLAVAAAPRLESPGCRLSSSHDPWRAASEPHPSGESCCWPGTGPGAGPPAGPAGAWRWAERSDHDDDDRVAPTVTVTVAGGRDSELRLATITVAIVKIVVNPTEPTMRKDSESAGRTGRAAAAGPRTAITES